MPLVVCLVLDAMPRRHLGPALTPNLWSLAEQVPGVGRAVLSSATYPNFATFVTGVTPEHHGIWSNRIVVDGAITPSWDIGPSAPTVFHLASRAGLATAAILGDQHLVGVTGAEHADLHWPFNATLPKGAATDAYGYPTDEETGPRILAAIDALSTEENGFLFAQLNAPDTASHRFGPDSLEAADTFADTDAWVGRIVRSLRPVWDNVVLVVLSDHDQVTVTDTEPTSFAGLVPLLEERTGVRPVVVAEGDALLVNWQTPPPVAAPTLRSIYRSVESVEASTRISTTCSSGARPAAIDILFGQSGSWFSNRPDRLLRGVHGGRHTRGQVVVASGGHPFVEALRAGVLGGPVPGTRWAPTFAAVLGLSPLRRAASLVAG
jgi:arylsulfatase A-like enzyme